MKQKRFIRLLATRLAARYVEGSSATEPSPATTILLTTEAGEVSVVRPDVALQIQRLRK